MCAIRIPILANRGPTIIQQMNGRTTQRLDCSRESIASAAQILRRGGLVAMPTETVYGLAANALDEAAVASIFAAKGRPHWDPLIVHVASSAMLARVAGALSRSAEELATAFWPGPLTLLLPRTRQIGDNVTAGRPLVGVRWPNHPIAQALILATDVPLAAPSANRFGHISPSTAAHVIDDLDGRIDAVLDAGPVAIGLESTVLDPNTVPITIYRQGAIAAADIERTTGVPVTVFETQPDRKPESLPSPGVGIRHYAPRSPLRLVHSETELCEALMKAPTDVAVLRPAGWDVPDHVSQALWGAWDNAPELAHNLYAALRDLDARGSSLILAPLPDLRPGDDLRSALRDRLLKAAMPSSD